MLFRVDPTLNEPLSMQIAANVRRSILAKEVRIGGRLPSASSLAEVLNVSIHTVLAAYQSLRSEGVIELRRGRGAIVRMSGDDMRLQLYEPLQTLFGVVSRLGLDDEELLRIVRDALGSYRSAGESTWSLSESPRTDGALGSER